MPLPRSAGQSTFEMLDDEVRRSRANFPEITSAHHGLGVLEEEVFELKMEVYRRPSQRDKQQMIREAVQVAACAIRFIEEVCK